MGTAERQERLKNQQDIWKALNSHTHDLSIAKDNVVEEKPVPAQILPSNGSLQVPVGGVTGPSTMITSKSWISPRPASPMSPKMAVTQPVPTVTKVVGSVV